jgi:hypothetical protein
VALSRLLHRAGVNPKEKVYFTVATKYLCDLVLLASSNIIIGHAVYELRCKTGGSPSATGIVLEVF